jgi:hypothetical protein
MQQQEDGPAIRKLLKRRKELFAQVIAVTRELEAAGGYMGVWGKYEDGQSGNDPV